jgi:hypothetical protein
VEFDTNAESTYPTITMNLPVAGSIQHAVAPQNIASFMLTRFIGETYRQLVAILSLRVGFTSVVANF